MLFPFMPLDAVEYPQPIRKLGAFSRAPRRSNSKSPIRKTREEKIQAKRPIKKFMNSLILKNLLIIIDGRGGITIIVVMLNNEASNSFDGVVREGD